MLIGGSIAVNALISVLLVTAALASRSAAPSRAAQQVEDAPSFDFSARTHSRKLQQVIDWFSLLAGVFAGRRGRKGAEGSFMAAAATGAVLIPPVRVHTFLNKPSRFVRLLTCWREPRIDTSGASPPARAAHRPIHPPTRCNLARCPLPCRPALALPRRSPPLLAPFP